MAYFNEVRTAEQLKSEYKRLVLMYHPDRGGTEEDFKQIQVEYERLLRRVGNVHEDQEGNIWTDDKGPQDRYSCNIEDLDDGFRAVLDELIKFDGIEIMLVGAWLWIDGDTRRWKESLKHIGCKWSAKRSLWYWHKQQKWHRSSNKDFSYICAKYGKRNVTNGSRNEDELRKIA